MNAAGGPALFITEMPADQALSTKIAIRTDEEDWRPGAPAEVTEDWHDSHWITRVVTIEDPDGREMLVQGNGD